MAQKTSFKSPAAGDACSNAVVKKYVLSLDIGTSNVRCHLYDKKAAVCGRSCQKIKISYVGTQGVEIDPEVLWEQVVGVIKGALTDGNATADEVASIGISVQRATFIVWNKNTGKPYHNFIVWQDTRGEGIEKAWNESYVMKVVKTGGKMAYGVSRMKRFLAAAVINFRTNHLTIRLLWLLEKCPEIRTHARQNIAQLGTLDTWLIWKLTSAKSYCTEVSCASSTGIYDPFIQAWNGFFCKLMNIPIELFPPVWDTDADFGSCDEKLFGAEIPIRSAFGDQQSAMFAQCCFREGDVKITMGTGTFMNINVGLKPHASVEGFYPVTAWKRGTEVINLGEGASHTCGDAVQWLVKAMSIESPAATKNLAESVSDSNGTYFVPGFSGLQAPDNDFGACGSLMGLKSSTTKAHITRAVLEALAFRSAQIFESMTSEVAYPVKRVACDGGVAANDFVVQLISDLIGKEIHRMKQIDMSALGAAFMAGRSIGFWKSDDELTELINVEKVFYPDAKRAKMYLPIMKEWKRAVERSKKWYCQS